MDSTLKNNHIRLYAIVVFSIFYWVAALYKGFHVDEFYSWVYAERSSFLEILTLHDSGIGHPPLFHLGQKTIQSLFSCHHPFQVRLLNYIVGSLFIIFLASLLNQKNANRFFIFSLSVSAAILNTFVLARMWGMVCLASLFMLWAAERYLRQETYLNFALVIGAFLLGIFSDYNFILLFPFLILVLLNKHLTKRKFRFTIVAVVLAGWSILIFFGILVHKENMKYFVFYIVRGLTKICYEVYLMLFSWAAQEFVVLSLLIFLLILLYENRTYFRKKKSQINPFFVAAAGFILLVLLESLIQVEILRVRHVTIILVTILVFYFLSFRKPYREQENKEAMLFGLSFFTALIMLLSLNPFFYRTLIHQKFTIILLPFIVLILLNYSPRLLRLISVYFVISGIFFISSSAVDNAYVAPQINEDKLLVYETPGSFATQYLKTEMKSGQQPFILDATEFEKSCRVCSMGTNSIPFDEFDKFTVVGSYEFVTEKWIPTEFSLKSIEYPSFTPLDKFINKHLIPVRQVSYPIYRFTRK